MLGVSDCQSRRRAIWTVPTGRSSWTPRIRCWMPRLQGAHRRIQERRSHPHRGSRTASTAAEDIKQAAWLQDRRADHRRHPQAARLQCRRNHRAHQRALTGPDRTIPPGVKVQVVGDRTQTIKASVHDVQVTLAHDRRARRSGDLSCSCAISGRPSFPASRSRFRSLRHSAIMYLLGYSLDNLSLMGSPSPSGSWSTTRSS